MKKVLRNKNNNLQRVKSSLMNMLTSASSQVVLGVVSFIERAIFLKYLTEDLNGLNSLFFTVLSVLSISELGISTAIAFGLYKPIAEGDEEKVYAYMKVFQKAYAFIGTLIIIIGFCLTPFIERFSKASEPISHIHLYFIIYFCSVGLTYFSSYKQVLLEADQKKYIVNVGYCGGSIVQYLLQIIVVVYTKNFTLYLIVFFITNIGKNVILALITDKQYPFLKDKKYKNTKISSEEKESLIKNIKALGLNKLGDVMISSTDNLLISYFFNLATLGLYANYKIIIEAAHGAMRVFYLSITASIGNICATENDNIIYKGFKGINFVNYLLFSITTSLLIILFQPIISLWVGKRFLLDFSTTVLICIVFFLCGIRRIILNYHDAFGLFWADKYKALIEAAVNLVLSIIFLKRYGVNGIFIGTIVSNICVGIWFEAYVVYKHGFKRQFITYLGTITIYILASVFTTCVAYKATEFFVVTNWFNLIIKAALALLILFVLNFLIFFNTSSIKALRQSIKVRIQHKLNKI